LKPQRNGRPSTNRRESAGTPSAAKRVDPDSADALRVARRNDSPAPDLDGALEAMLGAVVRLAGATAGIIRVTGRDGMPLQPVAAAGFAVAVGPRGAGALESWCGTCMEAGHGETDCTRSDLCGREHRFPAERLGSVCKHIVAVPLQRKGQPVGILNLLFEVECTLPPALAPVLEATGELLGVVLENARLTRENLRISVTNERQMMANEVHDSLAQGLTYMRMRMSLLRHAIQQGDELRAFKYWGDVDASLGSAHRRLRELITDFRSRMDPRGLLHALRETTDTFFDRTGVELEFANGVPDLNLPVDREIQVFHIVQEALANVCKHAQARRVRLALCRKEDGYEIMVEDDGLGIVADPDAAAAGEAGHYGIAIMRERAQRLGGEVVLESAAGAGTRVRLRFPAAERRSEATG